MNTWTSSSYRYTLLLCSLLICSATSFYISSAARLTLSIFLEISSLLLQISTRCWSLLILFFIISFIFCKFAVNCCYNLLLSTWLKIFYWICWCHEFFFALIFYNSITACFFSSSSTSNLIFERIFSCKYGYYSIKLFSILEYNWLRVFIKDWILASCS